MKTPIPGFATTGEPFSCCQLRRDNVAEVPVVTKLSGSVYIPNRKELKRLVASLGSEQVTVSEFARLVYFCGEQRAFFEGKQVHQQVLRSKLELDSFLGSNIVRMYVKCGSLLEAREALDTMVERSVVLWTEIISDHIKSCQYEEAMKLFRKMQLDGVPPNRITFLTVLNACRSLEALAEIHATIREAGVESNPMVATTLIHHYTKWRQSGTARKVFNKVSHLDLFAYNAMIIAYAKDERHSEALQLFQRMQMEGYMPDNITFLAVLECCQSLKEGMFLHRLVSEAGLESELDISTELVSMYSDFESLDLAAAAFQKAQFRDKLLYTAAVEAHARLGSWKDSLYLICEMHQQGIKPGKISFSALLDASAGRVTREDAKLLHAAVSLTGLQTDVDVATALVNMHGKAGQLHTAQMIFDKMPQRSAVSWTTIISTYAQQGHVPEVLMLFKEMQLAGFVPSSVTYLCVLSACSHGGLLAEAHSHFISMRQDYGLTPGNQHYGCIIDLFGRSGQLVEAQEFIKRMPVEPDSEAWMALLGACKHRDDIELGQAAGKHVIQLDPGWVSGYVVLSSVYAA